MAIDADRTANSVVAVVLAAGEGSRFRAQAGADQDKLMALCRRDGGVARPVLEHVLLGLQERLVRRVVITRPGNDQVIALARAHGCEVVELESAGMGDSLAAAVASCPQAGGWLVVLGDMPFVAGTTLDAVIAAMGEGHIVIPAGLEGNGHPVGFGRAFGPALQALTGDQGARRLLVPEALVTVKVADTGIYRDIDVPANLT